MKLNSKPKYKSGKLFNSLVIIISLLAILGCRTVSNLLNPDKYSSSSNTTTSNDTTNKIQKKAYALVGQWGGKSFDNSKNVTFHFESPAKVGDKYVGNVTTDLEGVKAGTEKYIVSDEENVEFETPNGRRYSVKAEVSSDGETLTMTTANGIRTSYQRE